MSVSLMPFLRTKASRKRHNGKWQSVRQTHDAPARRLCANWQPEIFDIRRGVPFSHCRILFPSTNNLFSSNRMGHVRASSSSSSLPWPLSISFSHTHVPHRQWTNLSLYFNYILCRFFTHTNKLAYILFLYCVTEAVRNMRIQFRSHKFYWCHRGRLAYIIRTMPSYT